MASSDAALIDGRDIAQSVRDEVKSEIDDWTRDHRPPFLSAVLVGDDPASKAYVRGKEKDAAEVGIETNTLHFDADLPEEELIETVHDLNQDPSVDGILVHRHSWQPH